MPNKSQDTDDYGLTVPLHALEYAKDSVRRATIIECADSIMSQHDGVLCDNEMSLKLRAMVATDTAPTA